MGDEKTQSRAEPDPTEADVERAEGVAHDASSLLAALWHAPEHTPSDEDEQA